MFDVQQTTAGDWAVVAAGARALIVEAQDAAALRRLASAVAAGFAETLEALAADGFARTPSFGLIEGGAGRAMVAVRGPVAATVRSAAGERSIDADGVSTWLEQQVAEASSVALSVTGVQAGREALPLADGIVWAAGVSWSARAGAPAVPVVAEPKRAPITAPVDVEAAAGSAAQVAPVAAGAAAGAAAEAAAGPGMPADASEDPRANAGEDLSADAAGDLSAGAAGDLGDDLAADAGETRIPGAEAGETRIPDATLSEATFAEPADTTGYDHLFGATMVRSVEEAAVRPAEEAEPARIDLPRFITDSAPARPSAEAGDHDGLTIMSGSLGDLRDRAAGEHGDAGESGQAAAPSPRFFVDLADGRREYVDPPIVVGRAPVASTTTRGPAPRPVTVDSAERDISRSHTTVAVEGDTVVVTDLHSRNGTMIVLPGKPPQKLRSGEPTAVIVGTVVDLGSGVTLTVGEDA